MKSSNSVDLVSVELSVVVGQASIPIHQLLRMGRGAVIMLDAKADDPCRVYAGGQLIAKGEPLIIGQKVGIHLTDLTGE